MKAPHVTYAVPEPLASSPFYLLVEVKLQATLKNPTLSLVEFINERRDEQRRDGKVAYRKIAQELIGLTGQDMTHETVRRWHLDSIEASEQSAVKAA